ncbi:MAG TPA: hypothetical protein VIP29_03420 [Nitrososphaeraceae archaeon]
MTRLHFLIVISVTFSLLFAPSLASAEIKVTPPPSWQAATTNNSTTMAWFQNSTKSVFAIIKAPGNMAFPMMFVGPFMSQYLEQKGVLESADQISFGHRNHGYRYLLNLSSPSELANSSGLISQSGLLPKIPQGYDVPFKGMLILTEKLDGLYAIVFLSPKENFDSILNEINPTIDSIQFNSVE